MKRQNSANATKSPSKYFSNSSNQFSEILRQITRNCNNKPIRKASSPNSNKQMQQRVKTQISITRNPNQNIYNIKISESVPKNKLQYFQVLEQIGSGKFGKVYKCLLNQTKKLYAIKMIDKLKLKTKQMMHQLQREVAVQQMLKHQNILQFVEFFETKNNYCLVLECATGGTLFQSLMKQQNRRYSEPAASNIIKQVACAIQQMQKLSIIHRDLKPENILWCDGQIKISDFGWSVQDKKERDTLCGTIDYLPPEMVYRQQYDNSIDLWSLGVLTFELTTGRTPFQVQEGFNLQFPDYLSGDVKDLMRGLLTDKINRKPIEWVLNHVWLS
ncbi:unnamed protein product (macronuclear) [Paramecium tetraurelia]|uniref:Protein kinase domain-containing protein n=1 Tax=Paramecium tetraurelia TaxID=5888 RepID=A0CM89_PARTE|nr:uncharacterized protein GSPATT00008385001 [Paramecium tetraurelia]CAK71906.1 unnamed protein product [Paramecium tetraurelia]|eukprot:XP_001439303.1 hypothetical protein (macronuclear) [Paramecium tetraurelia strain d4-2]